jgi:hypothetical protein
MRVDTMFDPVYVLNEECELPKTGTYYIIASNGIFLHRDTGHMQGVFPVKNIDSLMEYNPENKMSHNFGKIDAILCYKIKTFFAKVVELYRSESVIILYYNPDTSKYALIVPLQSVSHGGVCFRRKGLNLHYPELSEAGYVPIGSIHSHCDFQAFHSGTDDADEFTWDGIHITFGHNHQDAFTISASLVMNDQREKVDPESILEGITLVQDDFYTLKESEEPIDLEEIDSWIDQIIPWQELKEILLKDDELND